MDFETSLNKATELAGDNSELASVLSELKSGIEAEQGKKTTAVGEVKGLKGFKHGILDTFKLDKDLSLDEAMGKIGEMVTGYNSKINSLSDTASSGDTKLANLTESFDALQNQFKELQGNYTEKEKAIALNDKKESFRNALTANGIDTPKFQDMLIRANINEINSVEDVKSFADGLAVENPEFKTSSLRGGADTRPFMGENKTNNSLGGIPITDSAARTKAINERLVAKGII